MHPQSYLQTLHDRYEDWLMHGRTGAEFKVPVLVLDADADCITNSSLHDDFCKAINEAIAKIPPPQRKEPLTGSPAIRRHKPLEVTADLPVRRLFVDDDKNADETK